MTLDVSKLTKEEFEKYDDELNRILKDFHNAIFNVINIADQIDPKNYHIEWVKVHMDLARKIDKENIIKRIKDKFWEFRNKIKSRDIAFFKDSSHQNTMFGKYIKNDENRPFMYSFINMIKKKVDTLSKEELDAIWDELIKILISCIEYKRLIQDYI
jgi:hypothetical protein